MKMQLGDTLFPATLSPCQPARFVTFLPFLPYWLQRFANMEHLIGLRLQAMETDFTFFRNTLLHPSITEVSF
jgi:hypothetical protein